MVIVYTIKKRTTYKPGGSWRDTMAIIEIEKYRADKNNLLDMRYIEDIKTLSWKDRGQITDLLKSLGAEYLIVDEATETQKLHKDFKILRVDQVRNY